MLTRFVSLGQLIKFAYDATGILPRKRSERSGLDDKDIKRIQKQLERLVEEEGSLMDRCGELVHNLSYELAGTIQNPKVSFALGESMMDLLDDYNYVVRNEGTYLSPKESLNWFCGAHAVPNLVLSIQKHILRCNIAAEDFIAPPDNDWYLPSVAGDSVTWPLDKAMQWVYSYCETSRTQFHCPVDVVLHGDPEMQQNLENATNWQKGPTLPSWPGLHWNFSRSLERLTQANPPHQRCISAKEQESILYVLFLARLSTYISKQLKDAYGAEFLLEMVERFKRQRDWLATDLKLFKAHVIDFIERHEMPEQQHDFIWFDYSDRYWKWFGERARHCAQDIQRLIVASSDHVVGELEVAQLCSQYSDYTVRSLLDSLSCASHLKEDFVGFSEALFKGFDLKKTTTTTEADVAAYEAEIRQSGLFACLEWMVHWNRALVYYRRNEDKDAFRHIEYAFESAKYSAGLNQYQIVNQFIELAAKNDNWKRFKSGVFWASYLGISVRWLRKDEPTEENLRSTFDLMKNAHFRYAV